MINTFNCTAAGGNTGVDDCPLDIGKIVGFFLVWKGFTLSAADLATDSSLQLALQAAAIADQKANRIFPVHMLLDITDNSAEPQQQTFGYGAVVNTDGGTYNWTFPFLRGGICLLKALQTFNGSDVRVLFYDANGTLFGWKVGDTLKGIPLNQFFANKWTAATGAAVANKSASFNFNPKYINEQIGFYKVSSFELDSIEGLSNVNLSSAAARNAGVMKIRAKAGCSARDLYALYATELAAVGNWRVTRNGAVVTITSVAVDANLSAWTITLDTTDPDYNAAGPFVVSLAPPSVLDAAGVEGYESIPVTVA